jgi:TonB family protein
MRQIKSGLLLLVAIPFVMAFANSADADDKSNVANAKDMRVTFVRDSSTDRQPAKTAFPKYPSIARRDRIEGEATVCFDIDVRGKVKHAKIKSYTHKIFKKPALRSARKSSFEPLRPDQVLARTKTCRTYRFRLDPILAEESGQ